MCYTQGSEHQAFFTLFTKKPPPAFLRPLIALYRFGQPDAPPPTPTHALLRATYPSYALASRFTLPATPAPSPVLLLASLLTLPPPPAHLSSPLHHTPPALTHLALLPIPPIRQINKRAPPSASSSFFSLRHKRTPLPLALAFTAPRIPTPPAPLRPVLGKECPRERGKGEWRANNIPRPPPWHAHVPLPRPTHRARLLPAHFPHGAAQGVVRGALLPTFFFVLRSAPPTSDAYTAWERVSEGAGIVFNASYIPLQDSDTRAGAGGGRRPHEPARPRFPPRAHPWHLPERAPALSLFSEFPNLSHALILTRWAPVYAFKETTHTNGFLTYPDAGIRTQGAD
ncbi:hypothetical protein DXG01_016773 [Tephrocybe rancida]|nr:hypothetical protein DXG01_016773 [Tephrocybe rancida]